MASKYSISRRSFLKAVGAGSAAVAAAGVLTACGGSSSSTASSAASTAASAAPATTELAAEQVLNLIYTDLSLIDVNDVRNSNEFEVLTAVQEGLFRTFTDENGVDVVENAGCESYDVSDDGLTYTFHLREGMVWSDDQPVTAQNYVDSWLRLVNPDLAFSYAFLAYGIVGAEDYCENGGKLEDVAVELVDDLTFKVTLTTPDPAFIKKVGMVCFYPVRKDLIDAAEAAGGNWTNDYTLHVYNGPFYISDRVLENNMTLKKNEKYWNADEVTLTQINLRVVDETSTQAQLMESQQIDVLKLTDFEYVDRWQNKVADGTFQYFSKDEPSVTYLVLNQHTEDGATGGPSGVMLNPKCRKAIALAFDREEFNAMFKEGLVTTAYGVIPYGITVGEQEFRAANPEPYADEDTSSDTIKALFEEGMAEAGVAGTASDVTLTVISYGATTEKTSQLEWFKQQLEGNLGVKVQIDTYPDSSTFVTARNAQQYDFYLQGWNGDYNDPMTFFELWVTGNGYAKFMGGYSNPEYDEMIEKAGTSQDDAERMELFGKAEKLLLDEGGLVPLYYDNSQIYVQGYVSGLSMPMFGSDFEFSRVKDPGTLIPIKLSLLERAGRATAFSSLIFVFRSPPDARIKRGFSCYENATIYGETVCDHAVHPVHHRNSNVLPAGSHPR